MLFNSFEYFFFLPLVFILYWGVFSKNLRLRNAFLLLASYVFYAWWDWRFLGLIIFSSILDYFVAHKIWENPSKKHKRYWLYVSLLGNLTVLGVFKYYNFFIENFITAFSFLGLELHVSTLQVLLPVGISFYTFQTLSYTIDAYRGKLEPINDWLAFFCFVSFFPQLVAGPIERARNLLPQFEILRAFNYSQAKDGLRFILWGLAKKIIIADTCAIMVEDIFSNHHLYSGSELVLGLIYFAFQLYGDFSGYSDIAIGSAKLLGFNLMRNFRYPFFSKDVEDFWRRWHISLTTWIRDYIFFAFDIKNTSRYRLYYVRNLFIVFFLIGLWHGAKWTFILWGVSYFFLFMVEYGFRYIIDGIKRMRTVFLRLFIWPLQVGKVAFFAGSSLLFVTLFRAEDISQAVSYYDQMISTHFYPFVKMQHLKYVPHIVIFLIWEWLARHHWHGLVLDKFPVYIRWIIYILIIAVMFYYFGVEKPFVYFQF